jgi:prepilin peptidase CpaA
MLELSLLPAALTSLWSQPRDVALTLLVLGAAVVDWRTYRIPNWLTVGGMVCGLLFNLVMGSAGPGLLSALGGLAVGLAVLLPLYVLRVMGAGDVKLMAAVGAFVGLPQVLYAVLFTFIAGGFFAVAFALWHRAFARMGANVGQLLRNVGFAVIGGFRPSLAAGASIGRLPYGISICVGTIAWLAMQQLG